MSAVWRTWWGVESHWNLGTGRGWSGSQSPHRGRTSAFQMQHKEAKLSFNPIPGGDVEEEGGASGLGGLCCGCCPSRVLHSRGETSGLTFLPPFKRGRCSSVPDTVLDQMSLGLDSRSTISCVTLGKLLNLSEAPFVRLYNAGGDIHPPSLVRRFMKTPRKVPCMCGCSKECCSEASSRCYDHTSHSE